MSGKKPIILDPSLFAQETTPSKDEGFSSLSCTGQDRPRPVLNREVISRKKRPGDRDYSFISEEANRLAVEVDKCFDQLGIETFGLNREIITVVIMRHFDERYDYIRKKKGVK